MPVNYESKSASGQIMQGIYIEKKWKEATLQIILYLKFDFIGKDPISHRIFAFEGNIHEKKEL